MTLLQNAGLAAAAVQDSRDLAVTDPQIAARGTFLSSTTRHRPGAVRGFADGTVAQRRRLWRSAPLLGEDNDYVFGELLGLGADRRAELAEKGVI